MIIKNILNKSIIFILSSSFLHAKTISNNDQVLLIKYHNIFRTDVGIKNLKWADDLSRDAEEWAEYLSKNRNCEMEHASQSIRKNNGENIFWASPIVWSNGKKELQKIHGSDVVNSWGSEKTDYNYLNNSCKAGAMCGHYTQIVWNDTKEVGCGMAICNDKAQLWVCRYRPAGNWIGRKPY